MVAEPLVVTAAQRDVDRRLDAPLPVRIEKDAEQPAVQVVHDVVVAFELGSQLQIAPGEDARALRDDPWSNLAHLEDRRVQWRGDGGGGIAPSGGLRDVQ